MCFNKKLYILIFSVLTLPFSFAANQVVHYQPDYFTKQCGLLFPHVRISVPLTVTEPVLQPSDIQVNGQCHSTMFQPASTELVTPAQNSSDLSYTIT